MQYIEGGKNLANVMNFSFGSAYAQGDIDALASDVDSIIGSAFLSLMRSTVSYVQTVVRGLASSVDLEAVDATSAGPGSGSGGPQANHTTFCLSLRTGLTGRSARGRFYTLGVQATDLASINTVTATYRNNWITALGLLRVAAAADGWTLGVVSRQNNGVKLTTGVFRTVTTIIAVNDQLDTQRRRMPV